MRVGVDLLSIERFRRIAEHPRFRGMLFTENELGEAIDLGPERTVERLAGRFCAKEATCKVLGHGFGQGLRWKDIEVTADGLGAPSVRLSGGAARLAADAGLGQITVSLTHQADLVVAVALAAPTPVRARAAPQRPVRRRGRPRRRHATRP